jgi:GNAT superfamily N-acetyltransferase
MSIQYRIDAIISAEQLADVFDRSGIRRPTGDKPRIQRMINAADVIVTAWNNETLVGVARAITDFSYCCYLSDLAVDREFQRQGIGAELVRRVQQLIGEESMLLLLSAPEAMDYYPKIGMDHMQNAFMFSRKQ